MSSLDSKLFVISGPSGAGKGTLVARVRERLPELGLTVSATTRKPRVGEVDGVNYYFLSEEEFSAKVERGEFVEWAQVHDHRYGTLVSEVKSKLADGHSLILEIDVQGALMVKTSMRLPMSSPRFFLRTKGTDSRVCCKAQYRRSAR